MRTVFSLALFLCSVVYAAAQDKVFMSSGKIIECKVLEVGIDEIKYKITTEPGATIFSVNKLDVLKIEFENGHIEEFQEDLTNPDLYENNRKNAFKAGFLAPLFGSSEISYEHSLRPGISLEGGIGIVGLGMDQEDVRPVGTFLRFGPRFFHAPEYQTNSTRYYHVLKGAYIQPQLLFGAFTSDYFYTINGITGPNRQKTRVITSYGSLMMVFGRQSVFQNLFVLDSYAGIGWGYNKTNTNRVPINAYDLESNPTRTTYGVDVGESNFPFALSYGIRIGFLPKPRK